MSWALGKSGINAVIHILRNNIVLFIARRSVMTRPAVRSFPVFILIVCVVILCAPAAHGQTYAVGNNGTILELIDDLYWQPANLTGLPVCDFFRVWGSAPDDVYVTGCFADELFHYNGTVWETVEAAPGSAGRLRAIDGNGADNVFMSIFYGGMYGDQSSVYHFDGSTWNLLTGTNDAQDFWVDQEGALFSLGKSWDIINYDWDYGINVFRDGSWSSEFYTEYSGEELYRLHGCGADQPAFTGWQLVLPISLYGGLLEYKDAAASWHRIPENMPCGEFFELCPVWDTAWYGVYRVSSDEIWFAGENGAMLWWRPEFYIEFSHNYGFDFNALGMSPAGDLYAVGEGGIIARWSGAGWSVMSTPTIEELHDVWGHSPSSTGSDPIPSAVDIGLSNYPNPFNPSTTISYTVDSMGQASLEIYDVTGRMIRHLAGGTMEPGTYSARWDGTNDGGHRVASGTYFLRLRTERKAVTRKIVLAR